MIAFTTGGISRQSITVCSGRCHRSGTEWKQSSSRPANQEKVKKGGVKDPFEEQSENLYRNTGQLGNGCRRGGDNARMKRRRKNSIYEKGKTRYAPGLTLLLLFPFCALASASATASLRFPVARFTLRTKCLAFLTTSSMGKCSWTEVSTGNQK